MENKYLEIYKLKYQKILKSSQIMYKTLSNYRELAFSSKKMLKSCDCYIQSLVILSLINSKELSLDILNQLSDLTQYEFVLKKIKLKKVKELDDVLIHKIKIVIENILEEQPLFIKVASFFDKIIKKIDPSNKIIGCEIIENCLLSMLLLVRNIDDSVDIRKYQNDIKIIYKYIER